MNPIVIRSLLCALLLASSAGALGWVSPTGHLDEEGGQWANLANAYDNPTQPTLAYAANSPRLGWSGWADFTLAAPIACGRVRVNCDFGYGRVDQIQVDVWDTDAGAWQTVHIGSAGDGVYTELTFTKRNVSQMRFRFHYVTIDWQFWLYEVGFYESPPIIEAPTVATLNATSVAVSSAAIHGLVQDDGGQPCQAWLEYGPTAAYGSITPVQDGLLSNQSFGAFIDGLSGTYHVRAVASNDSGTSYGDDLAFTVNQVPLSGWVSPTSSFTDPSPPTPNSGGWSDQSAVYDDEVLTGASLVHSINDASPGPYLYLTPETPLYADKIRFQAKKTPEITSIDVWLLIGGVWTNVLPSTMFNDAAGGTVWNVVDFTADTVSQARVRFSVPSNYGLQTVLHEFDFHTVGVERCWGFVDGAFAAANK
ncbi:MAG: hypothetical protein GF331_17920 [Chitinivibrionales bacterium]|nr:hypothetical protein [Chitinivibrionales bacterium]